MIDKVKKEKYQLVQNTFFEREKRLQEERLKDFIFVSHINDKIDLYKHKKTGYKECFWRQI